MLVKFIQFKCSTPLPYLKLQFYPTKNKFSKKHRKYQLFAKLAKFLAENLYICDRLILVS